MRRELLLGYRFNPRLADAGASRFWRMDPKADYGILNGLARQTINTKLIFRNWLVHSNLNVLGRYSFDLSPEVKRGKFRPLRQLK